jgi:hypothetical protein
MGPKEPRRPVLVDKYPTRCFYFVKGRESMSRGVGSERIVTERQYLPGGKIGSCILFSDLISSVCGDFGP